MANALNGGLQCGRPGFDPPPCPVCRPMANALNGGLQCGRPGFDPPPCPGLSNDRH